MRFERLSDGEAPLLSGILRRFGALAARLAPSTFNPNIEINKAIEELEIGPLILRTERLQDFEDWIKLRRQSRAHLIKWEPDWSESEETQHYWQLRLQNNERLKNMGRRFGFLIFLKKHAGEEKNILIGAITLNDIRLGNRCSGVLGYWVGEEFAGQGYATLAVEAMRDFATAHLGLNRVYAACQPGNTPSRRVLEKSGFHCEGLARDYLKINGKWCDHEIWAVIESLRSQNHV